MSAVQEVASKEIDGKTLQATVATALERGRFRLVIAVDQITPELRAIVEYLNRHLSDDVAIIALELGRLVLERPAEILVSATYGAEIAAEKEKGTGTARWSAEAVKEGAAAIADEAQRKVVLDLLAHAEQHGAVVKGGTSPSPSAGFYYLIGSRRPSVWSLFTKPDGAVIKINLASIFGSRMLLRNSRLGYCVRVHHSTLAFCRRTKTRSTSTPHSHSRRCCLTPRPQARS